MQYQDELESGRRTLKSGMTIQGQVEHYRKKLIRKVKVVFFFFFFSHDISLRSKKYFFFFIIYYRAKGKWRIWKPTTERMTEGGKRNVVQHRNLQVITGTEGGQLVLHLRAIDTGTYIFFFLKKEKKKKQT